MLSLFNCTSLKFSKWQLGLRDLSRFFPFLPLPSEAARESELKPRRSWAVLSEWVWTYTAPVPQRDLGKENLAQSILKIINVYLWSYWGCVQAFTVEVFCAGHQLFVLLSTASCRASRVRQTSDPHPLHCKVSQGSLTYHRKLFEVIYLTLHCCGGNNLWQGKR